MTTTTQTQHPARAVIRTVVQAVAGLAVLVPAVLGAVADGDPSSLGPWAATAVAVSAAVTRVMALPAVEGFLARFVPWLAATPGGDGASEG